MLEAQDDVSPRRIGDAVDVDLALAGRLGVGARRGIGAHGPPVQGDDVLRRRRCGARDHLRTAGSRREISRARSSLRARHVQQQRLLDLGAVEQVAAALGASCGMVGQHDRRAEQRVVGRRREHRESVDVRARHDRRSPRLGRAMGDMNAPPVAQRTTTWRRQQREARAPRCASAPSRTSVVFDADRHAHEAAEVLDGQRRGARTAPNANADSGCPAELDAALLGAPGSARSPRTLASPWRCTGA
jgi:hypothetical protein